MSEFDTLLSIVLGIGLAATAGLRVFVPLLFLALANHFGAVNIGADFAWLSSTSAIIMLSVAALLEVTAYYVPGLDHLLDTAATPAAVIAGILLSAAVMTDLSPGPKWALAIIAGGGAAALTQISSVVARAHSGAFTAGLGNPIVATVELIGAIIMSVLSLVAPFIAVAVILLFCLIAFRLFKSRQRAR
jgi:hypothetical protein